MRYLIALLALILIVAGCSTAPKKPSTPPNLASILANRPNFNGVDPSNPSNICTNNCDVPYQPPHPIVFGTNLCLLQSVIWKYTTNGSGDVLNLVTVTVSNAISGHQYEVWQHNNSALIHGPIAETNGWLPHGTTTPTTNWFTNLSLSSATLPLRFWIAQDLTP